jgi:hypothetical protein
MLVCTSLLYSTIVVHAFHAQQALYHHIFLAVTICSVLRYTTDSALVHRLDALVAHVAFIAVCAETHDKEAWFAAFPACVLALWIAEHVWPPHAIALHASLHIISVVGVHCYIFFRQ